MPKNDNAHSLRLIDALRSSCGEEAAKSFANDYPLSKGADVEKKYHWACDICTALETQYDPDKAVNIRRACRCGDGKKMAQEISGCINKSGSLAAGCAAFSRKNKYAFLEYINEHELVFGYHTCVCSCIKRAEGNIPALWCECSVGYTEAMFQQVFGDTVSVTLMGCAKSGASQCRFCVHW